MTWSDGVSPTGANFNTHVRDNLIWVKDALDLHGITSDAVLKQLKSALVGVRATKSGTGNIADDGTFHAVAFNGSNSYESDTANSWHDPASNNSRITVPTGKDGYFLVGGYVEFAANGTNIRKYKLQRNGTTDFAERDDTAPTPGTLSRGQPVDLISMNAGDYVEFLVQQNSGGTLAVQGGAYFWAVRLFST